MTLLCINFQNALMYNHFIIVVKLQGKMVTF